MYVCFCAFGPAFKTNAKFHCNTEFLTFMLLYFRFIVLLSYLVHFLSLTFPCYNKYEFSISVSNCICNVMLSWLGCCVGVLAIILCISSGETVFFSCFSLERDCRILAQRCENERDADYVRSV